MIKSEKKSKVIAKTQLDKNDTGSSAVQVGILTERIAELTEHLKKNKHDFMARRGLLQMVGKRKRHLKYLARKDSEQYLKLVKELNIRQKKSA
jgi:small subunit ribosomal protein S15